MLASPHYGERWGQHWLDLAHYADSNGFELDAERPDAWRYRDWVVNALNADLPYDRFLMLQIAGDDLAPGDRDALIATGFCRCGPREVVGGNVIPEVKRQNELTEITGTVGSVFLGLTIGCARCHDHKFDAIPTTDYYRLQSFFAASELDRSADRIQRASKKPTRPPRKRSRRRSSPLRQQLAALEAPYRAALKAAKMSMLSAEERAGGEYAGERPHAGAEETGQGPGNVAADYLGRGGRRRSRPTPPITSGANGSSERSTRSNERSRGRPRMRWHSLTRNQRRPTRSCLRRGDYKLQRAEGRTAAAGCDFGVAARRGRFRP